MRRKFKKTASLRLKGWNYSNNGYYFVTFCTFDRKEYLGKVIDEKMKLSVFGKLAKIYWELIPVYFNFINLDEFVIMPDHIHGLLKLDKKDSVNIWDHSKNGGVCGFKNHMHNKFCLSKVIKWYKGRCTYEINKMQNNFKFQWQTRYHDKIIFYNKSEQLIGIRKYIRENPKNRINK